METVWSSLIDRSRRLCFATALLGMVCGGCADKPTVAFRDKRPLLDPGRYFEGRTRSWGVIETSSGRPTKIIRTNTLGQWKANGFHFEQDIEIEGRARQHRSWLLKRVDENHYTATGTGIVGKARAEPRGNAMHLRFRMRLVKGNPLLDVQMSQWLYLQSDGHTLINSATLTKGGVVITRIVEHFEREPF